MDKCFYSLCSEMLSSQTGIIYIRSASIPFLLISCRGDHAQIISLIKKKKHWKKEKCKMQKENMSNVKPSKNLKSVKMKQKEKHAKKS